MTNDIEQPFFENIEDGESIEIMEEAIELDIMSNMLEGDEDMIVDDYLHMEEDQYDIELISIECEYIVIDEFDSTFLEYIPIDYEIIRELDTDPSDY
jgi:hypothetical protein